MTKTVIISDDLAALLEDRRRAGGYASLDAAAEALLAHGLAADAADDHSAGFTDEQLRALIDAADASGPPEPWDAAAVKAEVLRRYREQGARS